MLMKLLKRLAAVIIAAAACTAFAYPACAANSDKVVDMADLLTDDEEQRLEKVILEIIQKYDYSFDIAAVTTNSTDSKSAEAYADDYYDYNGYGYDSEYSGLLLLIDMEHRYWHITTCGNAVAVFTDRSIDRIGESITPYLSDEDYFYAVYEFAQSADEYIERYESTGGKSTTVGERLLISLASGLVIALIVCLIMKAQLKTAVKQFAAARYIRQGSLNVQYSRDIFLYRTVTRHKIETNSGGGSSTHTSSSGRSHGGGGGSF